MHSRLLPFRTSDGDTLGGFARLATLIARERAAAPGRSLLVDAGDVFQGTPFFNFYKGEAEFTCMSAMGYEAMALGNHELDEGAVNLMEMADRFATFPVLSVNVFVPPSMMSPSAVEKLQQLRGAVDSAGIRREMHLGSLLDLVPLDLDYTFTRKGDIRIALIGITTETLPNILTKRAFEGITMKPIRERLEKIMPYVHERADLVIVLSHCGLEADSALAATVPGIDVIISGHDHRPQSPAKLVVNRANDNGIDGTLLVETGSGGTRLGELDLDVVNGRILSADHRLIPVTTDIPEDSTVAAVVERYRAGLELFVSEVIAESPAEMPDEAVLDRPTALGNLVADYLRRAANADVALQNGGGIRAPLHAGAVRIGDIYAVLPFDNTIVTVTLNGKELREMCRQAATKRGSGGFPSVSGIAFDVVDGEPRDIEVGGMPLDDARSYTVAINSFTAGGGDGYSVFEGVAGVDSGVSLRDAVIDLMRKDRVLKPDGTERIRFR